MKTYEYKKSAGYQSKKCQICDITKSCCQHHIESGSGRRNSKVIWICDLCHAKVHNPTAYKLPSSWAYDNGYLVRHNFSYTKTMKKKKCTHGAKLYSTQDGCMKCQFCGALLKDNDFKKHKAVKPIEKKRKKVTQVYAGKNVVKAKMGYEKQNPKLVEAEKLKRHYQELQLHHKRETELDRKRQLQKEIKETKTKMLKLQDELQSMD